MGDNKNIDRLFEAGLKDYEADPPTRAKEAILAAVAQKQKAKGVLWWRWAAVVAALVLAFYSGYYYNSESDNSPYPAQPSEEPATKPDASNNSAQEQGQTRVKESESEKNISAQEQPRHTPGKENVGTKAGPVNTGLPAGKPKYDLGQQTPYTANDPIANSDTAPTTLTPSAAVALTYKSLPPVSLVPMSPRYHPHPHGLVSSGTTRVNYAADAHTGKKAPRYSLGIVAGMAFPFIENHVKTTDEASINNIKSARPEKTYAVGLSAGYRISRRWQVHSGLVFNQWKQTSTDVLLQVSLSSSGAATNTTFVATGYTSAMTLDFNGISDPTNKGQFEQASAWSGTTGNYTILPALIEEYRYIDIPLTLSYYILDKRKWNISLKAGINSRVLQAAKATLVYADGTTEAYKNTDLNPYTSQLIAGAGLGFNITRQLQLAFKPTLLYGISKVNTHPQTDTYFHQVLIYSSLSYRF